MDRSTMQFRNNRSILFTDDRTEVKYQMTANEEMTQGTLLCCGNERALTELELVLFRVFWKELRSTSR